MHVFSKSVLCSADYHTLKSALEGTKEKFKGSEPESLSYEKKICKCMTHSSRFQVCYCGAGYTDKALASGGRMVIGF